MANSESNRRCSISRACCHSSEPGSKYSDLFGRPPIYDLSEVALGWTAVGVTYIFFWCERWAVLCAIKYWPLCPAMAHDGTEGDEQAQRAKAAANKPPPRAKRTTYPRSDVPILRH